VSEELLSRLRQSIIAADPEVATATTRDLLDAGTSPARILDEGLTRAMLELGERWKHGEFFLPEIVASAAVFTDCNDLIEPTLLASAEHRIGARVMVATVKGDLHDLGKNMVVAMLKTAGFDVIDLGTDVSAAEIVDAVRREAPQVVGLSALLTTTLPEQRSAIEALTRAGLRDRVKVMVGGAPVTHEWAEAIGADGYGQHAPDAVRLVSELTGVVAG
jgi:5-methyltetrahydrofolate--homocysteine methyltransferase